MLRLSALLAIAALAPGCFYTEVINVAPEARIARVDPGAAVYIDPLIPIRLSAAASTDDDGNDLSYHWEARNCAGCPFYLSDDKVTFDVRVDTHDPIQVSLEVVDQYGAKGHATMQLEVANRLPEARIQVQGTQNPDGSYTVGKALVFAATGSDPDGDTVSFAFAVHPPPQSDPSKMVFTPIDAASYRLTPDVSGNWEVEVTASDGFGGRSATRKTVAIGADAPPCIDATNPAWSPDARVILPRSAGARLFSVSSVRDDLDPYPGSDGLHFRWYTGLEGQPLVEVDGHDLADLEIDPTGLAPGDALRIRVEVADRVSRTLPCAIDQAACSITSNSCYQRLTWTAEVR